MSGGFGVAILVTVLAVALLAPVLVPYDPMATQYDAAKQVLRLVRRRRRIG